MGRLQAASLALEASASCMRAVPPVREEQGLCRGGGLHETPPGTEWLKYGHQVHTRIEETLRLQHPVRPEHRSESHLRGLEVSLAEVKGRRLSRSHRAGFVVLMKAFGDCAQGTYEQLGGRFGSVSVLLRMGRTVLPRGTRVHPSRFHGYMPGTGNR